MANLQQGPSQPVQPSLQDGQKQAVQLPGLPPLAQKVQLMPKVLGGQVSNISQHSLLNNQFSAPLQPSMHLQTQLSQHAKNQSLQQTVLPGQPGVRTLSSMHPLVRPQIQVANSSSLSQQLQFHLLENPVQVTAASLGNKNWVNVPNSDIRPPLVSRSPSLDAGFQVTKFPSAS